MRIIIEQDDNIIDNRIVEPPPPVDQVHDAGPAPIEMLRRFGRLVSDDADLTRLDRAPDESHQPDEPRLNPLRAGQARARALKAGPPDTTAADQVASSKGGKAPGVAAVRRQSRSGSPATRPKAKSK